MATIELKDFILGGMADSEYFGNKNSVAEIVGFDMHSYPGKIIVNQKLTKESGTTVDDLIKARVSCSDGNTYLFGATNGKIWKRDAAGTYTLEATASPAAGSAGILDAEENGGYIYYAMQNRLGRVAVGAPTNWATRNDSWATFSNGDATYHPMKKLNGNVYIGDGNFVAVVDSTNTFTADALDIVEPLRVSALGNLDTDLLVGTYVNTNVMETQFLRWNTWSDSWTYSDPIPEVGINAFLAMDNQVVVSAGRKGHLYRFDGLTLDSQKKINGDFPRGTTNTCTVHHKAVFNFNTIPLFGLSQVSGNGAKYALYSYARHSAAYPFVLAIEYVISEDTMEDIEIGMIVGVGDIFLVSWKSGSTYGVDKLDLTAKYNGAYMESRWAMADRREPLQFGQVDVAYALLPANTDIAVKKQFDADTAFGSAVASVKDEIRMLKSTKEALGDAVRGRIRIETTATGNTAPEIEAVYFDVDTSGESDNTQ